MLLSPLKEANGMSPGAERWVRERRGKREQKESHREAEKQRTNRELFFVRAGDWVGWVLGNGRLFVPN
jgi:hypothetical protein